MATSYGANDRNEVQLSPAVHWRSRLVGLPTLEGLDGWTTPFIVMDLGLVDENIATIEHFFSDKTANVRPT